MKYRVIISGNVMPEFDHQQVAEGLADLFRSQISTMEHLLKGIATPLKKHYDKEQAQIICANIRKVGAQCTIEEVASVAAESGIKNEINDSDTTTSSTAPSAGYADNSRQSSNSKHQTLLMQFVNNNTDYYQHQFSKFVIGDGSRYDKETTRSAFKITWHWPAFFCFFFWALYRKMWLWAAINMIGGVWLMLWISSAVVSLCWLLAWPVLANYLYFLMANTAAERAMENPQIAQHYVDKGGVSKAAVWGGIIVVLISTILVSNYVTTRFMDKYGEQIQDVLPGSGSQIRGTGLSFEVVDSESKLARTSLILSALATSLKILLLRDNEQAQPTQTQLVIETFINHLNADYISDGWGGKIRVEQQVDRYALISAGPDQVFKTADDVIQPIMIW